MQEPAVIAESLPFISRDQLVKLSRPRFETVREAASQIWKACKSLRLSVQVYTTATLYLQRFLVLNPQMLDQIQNNNETLREISCACIITAFLTEGTAKKVDDTAAVMHVSPNKVISLQREVLETNAFDFRVQTAPQWVIKLAKFIKLDSDMAYNAYLVAIDAYETTAVLQFPAHHVAAACIEFAIREEQGFKGNNGMKAVPHWDVNALGLKVVALRTTSRLLLEFYERCEKNNLDSHGKARKSKELQNWLAALQKSVRPIDEKTPTPSVRTPEISREGTARYIVKRRRT